MLIVPPVLEPLTLIEAKLRAGLDWAPGDPRDGLMTSFIMAARSQVERDTGIALLTQTHTVSLSRAAGSCRPFALPWRPVQSVVVDVIDPASVWDADQYVLEPSSVDPTPARLELASGSWPDGLRATIVVGFTSVALLAAAAPLLVHAVGLLTAHYATLGRDLASLTPAELVPMGYADAIAPYQLVVVA